tara:strand:- start:217 stop:348 length:132 start_codon:yes stop_codon:yes gene_type:complete
MKKQNKKILKKYQQKDKNKKKYDGYGDDKDNKINYERERPPHW